MRDVGARNEQHESHGAEERQERRPRVLDDVVLQRHDADAHVRRLVYGMLLPQLPGDAVHLGLRLSKVTPGFSRPKTVKNVRFRGGA